MSNVDELLEQLKRDKWAIETTAEMARRVGIPADTGRAILAMARVSCRSAGVPLDMVMVARAVKYAGDNKDRLKQR